MPDPAQAENPHPEITRLAAGVVYLRPSFLAQRRHHVDGDGRTALRPAFATASRSQGGGRDEERAKGLKAAHGKRS